MAIAAINILIVDFFVQYLVRGINNTALAFILMMILTIILFNLFFVFFFLKTKDFRAVKTLLIGILNSLKEKVLWWIVKEKGGDTWAYLGQTSVYFPQPTVVWFLAVGI